MTNNNEDYEMCLRAEGVVLPKNAYFGLSAATGGLADDHDVFHFLTTSLHVPGQISDSNKLPEADSAKLTQEYQDYQKKLDIQKEEYHKEHPEEKKEEFDDWFESDNQRELRQIWQSQSQMTDVLRDLSRKMDEVIGRQERTMGNLQNVFLYFRILLEFQIFRTLIDQRSRWRSSSGYSSSSCRYRRSQTTRDRFHYH